MIFFFFSFSDISINPTLAENVVVPDSGEESEDEWNYINVKKEIEESHDTIAQNNIVESQETCFDVSNFIQKIIFRFTNHF